MTPLTELKMDPRLLAGVLVLALLLGLALGALITLALQPEPTEPSVTTQPETTTGPTLPPNPFGPGDFAYADNGFLVTDAGTAVPGIDVSEHQQHIDWAQVKASGVEFVMIRLGWRGQTMGALEADTLARVNYAGAKAAGLKIGAYFFSQAITPAEALEEAEFALDMIREWELDMPVVFDWEPVSPTDRTSVVDTPTLLQCARTFCDAVAAAGYRPMIYFNPFLAETLLPLEEVDDYAFWLASYGEEMDFPHAVELWQFSCTGRVPGIETPVDLDLWFPDAQS